MKSFPRSYFFTAIMLLSVVGVQGCGDRSAGASSASGKQIEAADISALDINAMEKITKPNCVIDVDPGKIKKCKPELEVGIHGVSGTILIDGIRPDRNWAPMVALELSSIDEANKFRIKFNITEYKTDAEGKAILQETPFKGVAELWTNRNNDWSTDLAVEIMPALPFEFVVVWNDDQSLSIRLGETAWKTGPIGFDVDHILIMGSGVMASTDNLSVLKAASVAGEQKTETPSVM